MSRERRTLEAPPEDLDGFPRLRLGPHEPVYRLCRRSYGPWWFGSSGAGRFDLEPPRGTCYLAADPLAALVEAIGPGRRGGAIAAELLADRELHRLHVPRPAVLADTTAGHAAAFGVTSELSTIVPYELPRRWAAVFDARGFDGLAAWLRHPPERALGIALFGPAGELRGWPTGQAEPIGEDLAARLTETYGIRVLRRPRLDELRLAGGV